MAKSFRVVPYDIPRGSVAGYYPELNVLVPLSQRGRAERYADVEIGARFVPSRPSKRRRHDVDRTDDEISEDQFMQIVSTICASDASLTAVGCCALAAHHRVGDCEGQPDICAQARDRARSGASRNLGNWLASGYLTVVSRNERTQRAELALTETR